MTSRGADPVPGNAIVHVVVAARPNFMKAAPLWHALHESSWSTPVLVHAGQHYDAEMSQTFIDDLDLAPPDVHLATGSGTHAEQTAAVLVAYERTLLDQTPDCVVVVGDVNATMAAALAAVKVGVKVVHLEAGLRNHDRSMPEEVNRVVTDSLADLLWAPSQDAVDNLVAEGVHGRVELVGNLMLDSVERLRDRFTVEGVAESLPERWALVTMHRPVNVDRPDTLRRALDAIRSTASKVPVIFPVHPRTRQRLIDAGELDRLSDHPDVTVVPPLGYLQFMGLLSNAAVVVTDSGGVQEETTYLGVPCLTVRRSTERPTTILEGTNRLVSFEEVPSAVSAALRSPRERQCPPLWDGRAAPRAAESLRLALAGWRHPGQRPDTLN